MARLARAIVPGLPLHITQRGNRRQNTFFGTDDYLLYLSILAEWCDRLAVEIWAYCLMPNHVHLIAVPSTVEGLRRAIGEAHRRYTTHVNQQHEWRGHLWQGRFASFVMDERHTLAAARYIELNPVRAKLAARAEDYPWSSARAHLLGRDDGLVKTAPLRALAGDWSTFLDTGPDPADADQFRRHAATGRPLGADAFVDDLERLLGRILRPRKPGPRSGDPYANPACQLLRSP
jgi:putative transposase